MVLNNLLGHGLIELDMHYMAWVISNAMETIQFSIDTLEGGLQFWRCMWMILSSQPMMRQRLDE
jgi:hypothetical protein